MNDQKDVVKNVIDYIEKNLEEKISLEDIARESGYSKFHLNRIFAEHTGVTIYRYLSNRRLTVAAEKLVRTDTPISQIACEAGYDTQQAFSFAFKQLYLSPPRVYRNLGVFIPRQDKISMSSFFTRKCDLFTLLLQEAAA